MSDIASHRLISDRSVWPIAAVTGGCNTRHFQDTILTIDRLAAARDAPAIFIHLNSQLSVFFTLWCHKVPIYLYLSLTN
jgi:hypothetical protein